MKINSRELKRLIRDTLIESKTVEFTLDEILGFEHEAIAHELASKLRENGIANKLKDLPEPVVIEIFEKVTELIQEEE